MSHNTELEVLSLGRNATQMLWFNPAVGNQVPDSHLLTPPLSPQWDGEENGTDKKGKSHQLR